MAELVYSRRMIKTTVSKAQPKKVPQAYPPGYVADAFDVRTKLAGFWDNLLKVPAVTVPNLSRHTAQLRQMQDRFGHFLS